MRPDIALLSIGSELLLGYRVNTNAQFLSQYMAKRGYETKIQVSVADDVAQIGRALEFCFAHAPTTIITGGLGPTDDDMTREGVARFFGVDLLNNAAEEQRIRELLRARGMTQIACNLKQACFPDQAAVLPNPGRTAAGFALIVGGRVCVALPGVPAEMVQMVHSRAFSRVLPNRIPGYRTFSRIVTGLTESEVQTRLAPLAQSLPRLTILASFRQILVSVPIAQADYDAISRTIGELFADVPVLHGSDPIEAIITYMTQNKLTIACAESATGGLLSTKFTAVPGASNVFLGSAVTYSNAAKQDLCAVKAETLAAYGAVSAQVAEEMAAGVRRRFGADLGVSITGIAGPGGETGTKPLGLFYMAATRGGPPLCRRFQLGGNRHTRQKQAVSRAVYLIIQALLGKGANSNEKTS